MKLTSVTFLGTRKALETILKKEDPMIYKWLKRNGVKCENSKRPSKKGKSPTKKKAS